MFPYNQSKVHAILVPSLKMILEWIIYIQNICRSASYALYKIGRIRNYLDEKSTETLIHAFITCHIDQCNSLLYGLPDSHIAKLQRIQNSAARLVTRTHFHDHITPVLALVASKIPYHVQNFDSDVQVYSWICTTIFTRTHTGGNINLLVIFDHRPS